MFTEKVPTAPPPGRSLSESLSEEMENALGELQHCMAELEVVLTKPRLDRAKLTTLRLKIAQLRLARGPLMGKIAAHLAGNVGPSDAAFIKELRASHAGLLSAAAAHTAKWTMDAIEADWPAYKVAARLISQTWMEKLTSDQRRIAALLRRS